MKLAFKHASMSYQTFKMVGSGLKNKSMTCHMSDLGFKIFDQPGLDPEKLSLTQTILILTPKVLHV